MVLQQEQALKLTSTLNWEGRLSPALPGEGISGIIYFCCNFFFFEVEFCSCSWQPATPEGNSSLWLPTRDPCPCRAELDGAQTEHSPTWKQDRAACATAEPRAQGSGNACGGSQGPDKAVPNPCLCAALNLPQKHLFSYATCFQYTGSTQQEKLSRTITTTTEVLLEQHSHTCWSHPHSHGCLE